MKPYAHLRSLFVPGVFCSRALKGANPDFPALRSGPTALSGASRRKKTPSSKLGVGNEIVMLALGLAFGLGGKERARELIEGWSRNKV